MANIVRINGKSVKDLAAAADIAAINTEIGNLADLDTTDKSSLVAAINEAAQSGGGGGAVNDVQVNSTSVVTDGVANVPLADTTNPGVVKMPTGTSASIFIDGNGAIHVSPASPGNIKSGTSSMPISAGSTDAAAFYGLARAAGDTTQKQSSNPVGTYTANAKQAIKTMLSITDITSYNALNNKPSINGVTLSGNSTLPNLGIASAADLATKYTKPSDGIPASDLASAVQTSLGKADTALQTAPVASVAGKTGAVTLDAGDVEYDDTDTYAAGTVGAGIAELKSEIGDLSDLDTTAKSNLVAAINEAAQSGGGSVDLYYVTPEQYGAVGDGVTDDSQAVQDACDAGYAVYFDSGKTYYLASTVTIDHDCHLFGGEGATIKTKTPTGGTAPNGIVVNGILKKTTTMTTDYTSEGDTANCGNKFTLSDMTGIAIGDIMVIEATDQYYNYARQYYHLGATLLVTDIYDGHIYTSTNMPYDIENTANVSVKIYSAPKAVVENLKFESDGFHGGNYHYLLSLLWCKCSVVKRCEFSEMDNGVNVSHCANTLVDGVLLSKSKYDNTLNGDGYGIVIDSCLNTVVERVLATCAQHAISITGHLPAIDTFIRNCELTAECRTPGLDTHESVYNLVVEDSVLGTATLNSVSTIIRCRIIGNRRVGGNSQALSVYGSHAAEYSKIRIVDTVFEQGLFINVLASAPQNPVAAFDNVFGSIEIVNCTGGYLVYNPATTETILSNTINRLLIDSWTNVDKIQHTAGNGIIKALEIRNTVFGSYNFISDNVLSHGIILDGIEQIIWNNAAPILSKSTINRTTKGECSILPGGVPINVASNNASAKFRICGANITSNAVEDYLIGGVSGNDGADLVRTVSTPSPGTLSVNTDGDLVYAQGNNTSSAAIYPVGMYVAMNWSIASISATLKNTGNTDGASFRFFVAVVDGATGKIVERRQHGSQATAVGAYLTHDSYEIKPGDVVLPYIHCYAAVANAITTFEDFTMSITPVFGPTVVNEDYTAVRRTGDGTLLSLPGVNNICCSEDTFTVKFEADMTYNPIWQLPSASGVSF